MSRNRSSRALRERTVQTLPLPGAGNARCSLTPRSIEGCSQTAPRRTLGATLGATMDDPTFNFLWRGDVLKTNSAGKQQTRTFIITPDFIYTCLPGKHTHFRRRIKLGDIGRLLVVAKSFDILVVVPTEYDLWVRAEDFEEVLAVLKLAYREKTQRSLAVESVDESELASLVKKATFWSKSTRSSIMIPSQIHAPAVASPLRGMESFRSSDIQVLHSVTLRLMKTCASLLTTFTTQWSSVRPLKSAGVTKAIVRGMEEAHRLICVATKEMVRGRDLFENGKDLNVGDRDSDLKVDEIVTSIHDGVIAASWSCVGSAWGCCKFLMRDNWERSTFTEALGVPAMGSSLPMVTRVCQDALGVFQASSKQLLAGAIELLSGRNSAHRSSQHNKEELVRIRQLQRSLELLNQARASF